MIKTGLDLGTLGARYRVNTRGFLRATVRAIADDATTGTLHIRRSYGEGGPEVAYSVAKVLDLSGEPTTLEVDDCPELTIVVVVAGSGTFDLEFELGSPCTDSLEVVEAADLTTKGPLWRSEMLELGILERVSVVAALETPHVKGAVELRAYLDAEAATSYTASGTGLDLENAVNTYTIPAVHGLELYCTGQQANQYADLYIYRVTDPYKEGLLPDNVAYIDAANTFSLNQFFQSSIILGDISTGISTLTSNSTSNRAQAFPDASGEIMVLNSSQTPSTGDFARYNGNGLDAVPLYGSSFPSSPVDGQPFYRTDLDMPELFHYDSTRGKWLGELRSLQYSRAGSFSSGLVYLRWGNLLLTSSRGSLTPSALTIVGAEYFNGVDITSGSADLDFYEGGTNLTTLLTINARGVHDHSLNYDLDADTGFPGKYPQINNVSGLQINNPIVVIYMRRRET